MQHEKPNKEVKETKSDGKKKHPHPKEKETVDKPFNSQHDNLEGPLNTLEKEIMRLQEHINKQNTTIDHLASEVLKLKGSGNKPDLSQFKKVIESKNKTIFDTLNVQQSCLDSIGESLEKHSVHLAMLKDKLGVTSSACKNLSEEHKFDIDGVIASVDSNSTNISKLNENMKASTLAIESLERSLHQEIRDLASKMRADRQKTFECSCKCMKKCRSQENNLTSQMGCRNLCPEKKNLEMKPTN